MRCRRSKRSFRLHKLRPEGGVKRSYTVSQPCVRNNVRVRIAPNVLLHRLMMFREQAKRGDGARNRDVNALKGHGWTKIESMHEKRSRRRKRSRSFRMESKGVSHYVPESLAHPERVVTNIRAATADVKPSATALPDSLPVAPRRHWEIARMDAFRGFGRNRRLIERMLDDELTSDEILIFFSHLLPARVRTWEVADSEIAFGGDLIQAVKRAIEKTPKGGLGIFPAYVNMVEVLDDEFTEGESGTHCILLVVERDRGRRYPRVLIYDPNGGYDVKRETFVWKLGSELALDSIQVATVLKTEIERVVVLGIDPCEAGPQRDASMEIVPGCRGYLEDGGYCMFLVVLAASCVLDILNRARAPLLTEKRRLHSRITDCIIERAKELGGIGDFANDCVSSFAKLRI